ncbi:hypothetical protein Fleli_3214 [Bernardetia litoralis DSM 6794]|uniref:Uncharacterized protein n=1 Tax=Bernardetia litoralis (strain ATCC 23117 / DSM 6794 / NBRC 15988 / NCIMB 1366 / Fx l1 / Sio-4) TaxID=880071 RepID=I4ANL1_BERLS|nr:tetratricopeptide repeat protein [Bernardetia litoralis]AFM05546.1 hypothetical protein Fleli_3214 [Bernardetia litoralis DSM 6794]
MKSFSQKLFIFLVFLGVYFIGFSNSFAQDANQLLQEGIAFHDARKYDKALKKYEQALKLIPNSPVIHYEMALTYFDKKNYKTAIKYSDKVIKSKSQSIISAYVIKGSSLDMLGKTQKSIKLFEGVIKKYPENYLLHYNLALNYYKIGELKKAEQSLMSAIGVNPEHTSSHLMLGYVEFDMGRKIPSMMAFNYFLFLEPTSQRSDRAFEFLNKQLLGSTKKGENNEITINIGGGSLGDNEFGAIELVMSITQASKSMDLKKELEEVLNEELEKEDSQRTEKVVIMDETPKTEEEIFEANTKLFFSLLDGKDKNNNIWWVFYAPTFNTLEESEHITTFCYWISQQSNENASKWVEENSEKVLELKKWIAKN